MSQNEEVSPLFAPSELDNAVTEFISTVQTEYNDEPAVEASVAPSQPAPETPVLPAPEAVKTPQEPAERGLERLVAREVELRERETRVSGTEKEVEALRTRLRELEPRAFSEELLNKIKLSPQDGLRAIGLDPDEIIRTALAEKIGDRADPQTRELLERTRLRKEMESLKAQVQEAERRTAAQAYFNQVANGARGFLSQESEVSKHAPIVAQVARVNPDRVYQEIMEEITRDAAVRSRQEPNGDVIPYSEAAKRVEARWGAMKALLAEPLAKVESPNASMPTPETKQNVTKSPSTIKPPDRPLAPWLQRVPDEETAIRDAVAEWRRAETQK